MATYKSLEDLAALKKEMQQEKEFKTKQIISTKSSYANKFDSSVVDKNVLIKQNKKDRKNLIRKLERKGLSENAIKAQLRPRLTWNERFEENLKCKDWAKISAHSVDTSPEKCDTPKSLNKTKVCKLCGKKIMGDVLTHFRENHFSFFVQNKDLIKSKPGAFAVEEEKFDPSIHLSKEGVKPLTHAYNHKKMRCVISDLRCHPEEQTYRGSDCFECDACENHCKHGKVLFVSGHRTLHLCYECYKIAKSEVAAKRGNKHVFIDVAKRN